MAGKNQRRSLDFQTADAAIAEIERLQASGYRKAGNWNLTQICEHLSATLRVVLDDGPCPRMPWLLRKTIGNWMVGRVLKRRKMSSGMPTLKSLKPTEVASDGPEATIDDNPETIATCIADLRRAGEFTGPMKPHPLADLTAEQWQQFSFIHAAHHLSFLLPLEETTLASG